MIELNQVLDSCPSTNTWLANYAREQGALGAPHGSWISARVQPAGKGRQGRSWISAEGNLFLSIVVRDLPQSRWTWLPITTALAVVQAVRGTGHSSIGLEIKWPNDLVVRDVNVRAGYAKVGGILVEAFTAAASTDSAPYLIVGIGLNVAHAPEIGPEGASLGLASRSLSELGARMEVDELRPRVIAEFLREVDTLRETGPERERIDAQLFFKPGAPISWGSGGSADSGRVVGLGPHGELRVELSDGSVRALLSEDVQHTRLFE